MPELRGRQELTAKLAREVGVTVSRGSAARAATQAVEGAERGAEAYPEGAAGIVRYAYGVPFRTANAQSSQPAPADAPVSGEKASSGSAPTTPPVEAPAAPKKGRGARKVESREELLARLLDPTLTLEETARMLEVCPATVRRYTNRGILPHERSKGNQRRFKLSTVLAFMESQSRVEPHGESG